MPFGAVTPYAVWTQVPVAARTVEVNTKTGFSLTSSSPGVIKTVQRGTITLGNGVGSNTGTLGQSVDTSKSELRYLGFSCNNNNLSDSLAYLTLTNGTTVTATRNGSPASSLTVSFEVTEYN